MICSGGGFSGADEKMVLKVYCHLFLEKSMITQEKRGIIKNAFMSMFNQWFYQEYRLKEVESLGYLNKKKNYKILLNRMANNEFEVNKILI